MLSDQSHEAQIGPAAPAVISPKHVTLEQLRAIVELARWAPSGDNCQPWKLRFDESTGRLDILYDRRQPFAFLDVGGEASRMAIGALVENIRLAASTQSIGRRVEATDDPSAPVWSTVELSRDAAVRPDELASFIPERVSNRRLYEPDSCTEHQLQALRDALDAPGSVEVQFFQDASVRKTIGRAVGIADRVRMQHRQCHEEFHSKVRWTAADAERNPTGFDVRTFEIRRHEALLLQLTRRYGVIRLVDAVSGLSRVAARMARRQVVASGAIGMLRVTDRKPSTMFAAGRALQRVWLTSAQQRLAFQVLAVAPCFIRRNALGGAGFSRRQRRRIEEARRILGQIPGAFCPDEVAVMFRVGRAAAPSARSGRLSADQLLSVS